MPNLPEDRAIRALLHVLASDSTLKESYVLKGGNALKHVFNGPRSSVDVDLSAVSPTSNQLEKDTEEALKDFCERLSKSLAEVGARFGYAQMLVQSSKVLPPNENPRTFPAFEVKVGYTEREDRDPPYSDVVKLEVSLNEIVCDAEYVEVENAEVHVSSLNDIVSEKLRALLQQVVRNRNRPNDVFDIWFYTTKARSALDATRISNFLKRKCSDEQKMGFVTRRMFYHPEVRIRAAEGYDSIRDRLVASTPFPDFEEAFNQVLVFVESLDLLEGNEEDLERLPVQDPSQE